MHGSGIATFEGETRAIKKGKFRVTPAIYPCEPSSGAREVKNFERIPSAGY
jgi:hypothetical protein